jgi:hypothetical protein
LSEALAALSRLDALVASLHRSPALPDPPACVRQADALGSHEPPKPRPADDALAALRRELQTMCANAGAGALPPRLLRQAPLVFWHGKPQAAEFPGLLERFLGIAATRERWLRSLIEAWLRDFDAEKTVLPQTGHAIAALLPRSPDPRLRVWHDAHERYRLFDATEGPRRVARALLHGPDSVEQVLTRTGMDDTFRAGGAFFRATIRAMLADLPDALRGPTATATWERAAGLLEVGRMTVGGRGLRFGDLAGEIAQKCTLPWQPGEGREPAHAPRKQIESFLLRNLGDPRIEPRRWITAGEDATRLMRRWLSEASLEAFLALIRQNNDDKQWHFREAFWRACWRKMPTAEVWVVLGPRLASRAGAVRDLHESFGKLPVDQAVLLMKLGDLVLSEWSNVGPVRAWDINDRHCTASITTQFTNFKQAASTFPIIRHAAAVRRMAGGYVISMAKRVFGNTAQRPCCRTGCNSA